NWKSQLVARLERYKRYPSEAQSRGEYGVAQLAFSVDRSGGVHNARIVRSSGSSILDRETLTLAERAQPRPPPPPEITGSQIPVVVPIRYNARGLRPLSAAPALPFACSGLLAQRPAAQHEDRPRQGCVIQALRKPGDRCSDNGLLRPGCTGNGHCWRTRIKTLGNRLFNQRCKRARRHIDRRCGQRVGKALP